MPKFPRADFAELLGMSPLVRVTDAELYSTLLTPNVQSLLGAIVSYGKPQVLDTVKGLFPGDEVTNFNDHRLFGGSTDHVRLPYLTTIHRTEYGALVFKRDALKFKILGFHGDIDKGRAELIYKAALRDRRFDGTKRSNDCALVEFPFDDPALNLPLPVGRGAELSIYGFMPGSRIADATGDTEFERFVANPFAFMGDPDKFLTYFKMAWKSKRGPGQVAAAIPDVSRLMAPRFEKVARACGYDFLENAPSHYHVAMWAVAVGYRFTYEKDAQALAGLTAGIKRLKARGMSLTRAQESWVCVIQSLRPVSIIPEGLYLGGPTWPQNNLDQQNLWMNKPMTEEAARLLPGPLAG